jgi:hypothetical protein
LACRYYVCGLEIRQQWIHHVYQAGAEMKRLLLTGAAALTLLCSSAAMAHVNVGISIGIPGVILSQPDYYVPPVTYVEPPRVVVVPGRVYRPVPVYRSRYYRENYRVYHGHPGHGHWDHHHDHGYHHH